MEIMPAVDLLLGDLRRVFGDRLSALLAFGRYGSEAGNADASVAPASGRLLHTLAIVDEVTFADLEACAPLSAAWSRRGLAIPLILGTDELARSLDAFPLELAEIIATRRLIAGTDPFSSGAVRPEDVRRACEVQARSHLLHLREGFIEAAGRASAVARLVGASAAPFRALLVNLARLERAGCANPSELAAYGRTLGLSAPVVERLQAEGRSAAVNRADARRMYADCLEAADRVVRYVDRWVR
jgi:hypothetical protein